MKEYSLQRRILSWVVTVPYVPLFGFILCFFHPLQMIALRFGYTAHKIVLDLMNLCLVTNFRTAGTRFKVTFDTPIPEQTPVILVSNHQSMYDIPLIIWNLRKYHPKFIAKRELGKGIPSISFALRHMGSVLIDRGSQAQALEAIGEFGKTIATRQFMACIFPEGTRARDGKMKHFKSAGLITLLRTMPDALVVPMALDGSWELVRYKLLPIPFGVTVTFQVLAPVSREGKDERAIVAECELRIRAALGQVEPCTSTAGVTQTAPHP